MSLDRLINLAKRTGDRLIVHNPLDGHDIVIMSVDEYEELLDDRQNDLGPWKNNFMEEDNSEDFDSPNLDDEESSWHSAGSILEDKYEDIYNDKHDFSFDGKDDDEILGLPSSDFDALLHNKKDNQEKKFDNTLVAGNDLNLTNEEFGLNKPLDPDFFDIETKIKGQDKPFFWNDDKDKKGVESSTQVQYRPNLDLDLEDWQEEPLDTDDPVFYEEQV